MKFNLIDRENWDRDQYFEYYLNEKCTFSISANIDITALLEHLRNKGIKLYPSFIYMVSKIVNSHPEFRTCFNDERVLGYWDQMIPSYTIFHDDNKTFSCIWTEFSNEFSVFYENYQEDIKQYADVKGLFTKENEPKNSFPISSIPWVSFTGFNLNINNEGDFLLPIITGGKYFNLEDRTLLPISLQVHHAVCDGYHASTFLDELQHLANNCHKWLT
ncbi:type A chloramphenicol O-acetyltransferase [Neobacillus vireti]|uniref:Chloramphenicol acetyltransferase n=1 Tax=Neobacillus vireti LMG 21834 TaxID=1131730 RepID=A0AB94IND5_9BACI|nr:type A chloramphenicol O-acetyltransferase [Neobacillus vireti]ETI68483.1 chloramphenicol O-acetyltransferase [Neobacillus vireti LMG 21834]KLT17761.1 chloramphenicol acetyltransferase [Neobacillus vireti]